MIVPYDTGLAEFNYMKTFHNSVWAPVPRGEAGRALEWGSGSTDPDLVAVMPWSVLQWTLVSRT